MSPEQAKGRAVDRRADVWAFGCVLYEMLTGKRAFVGDDASETLAAVLTMYVDLDRLPAETPARLRRVLVTCLRKDSKERVRNIGDVRLAMEGAFETTVGTLSDGTVTPPLQLWQRPIPLALTALGLVVLTGLVVWTVMRPPPRAVARYVVTPPPSAPLAFSDNSASLALTPDGSGMVYRGDLSGDRIALFVRPVDGLETRQLVEASGL